MKITTTTHTTPALEGVTLELTADEARAVSRVLNGCPYERVADARLDACNLASIYLIACELGEALA